MAKEKVARKGECKYCRSMRIVNSEEELSQEELDRIASEECDCAGAKLARKKEESRRFAYEYADGLFESKPEARELMRAAITAVSEGTVNKATIKVGKNTYTITINSDSEIKIQKVYKDEDIQEF